MCYWLAGDGANRRPVRSATCVLRSRARKYWRAFMVRARSCRCLVVFFLWFFLYVVFFFVGIFYVNVSNVSLSLCCAEFNILYETLTYLCCRVLVWYYWVENCCIHSRISRVRCSNNEEHSEEERKINILLVFSQ